ncbi:MAG TPA: ABC transporter permease [Casimicrobiaceae bacterium]|nr:ABC transporter permease [Casimicrobiaceae bacterium]
MAKGAPAAFAGFRRPDRYLRLRAGARHRAASHVLIYLRTMVAFLIVWALVASVTSNPVLLPSPRAVFGAIVGLASDLELFLHAGISFARMVASLIVGSLLAIPLGLAMGRSALLDRIVDPTIEILRPISGIAWIPLALFMFGIGNALPIFIMTYAGFFPILLGTIAGVRSVDRRLIDAARTMGIPERTIVTRVVMPAALPSLMVALRLGVAASWTAVVAAELIGAPSGLGYAVEWYRELLMTPQVMAFIAMIGLLGYVCDLGVRALARALTPWAAA